MVTETPLPVYRFPVIWRQASKVRDIPSASSVVPVSANCARRSMIATSSTASTSCGSCCPRWPWRPRPPAARQRGCAARTAGWRGAWPSSRKPSRRERRAGRKSQGGRPIVGAQRNAQAAGHGPSARPPPLTEHRPRRRRARCVHGVRRRDGGQHRVPRSAHDFHERRSRRFSGLSTPTTSCSPRCSSPAAGWPTSLAGGGCSSSAWRCSRRRRGCARSHRRSACWSRCARCRPWEPR